MGQETKDKKASPEAEIEYPLLNSTAKRLIPFLHAGFLKIPEYRSSRIRVYVDSILKDPESLEDIKQSITARDPQTRHLVEFEWTDYNCGVGFLSDPDKPTFGLRFTSFLKKGAANLIGQEDIFVKASLEDTPKNIYGVTVMYRTAVRRPEYPRSYTNTLSAATSIEDFARTF